MSAFRTPFRLFLYFGWPSQISKNSNNRQNRSIFGSLKLPFYMNFQKTL